MEISSMILSTLLISLITLLRQVQSVCTTNDPRCSTICRNQNCDYSMLENYYPTAHPLIFFDNTKLVIYTVQNREFCCQGCAIGYFSQSINVDDCTAQCQDIGDEIPLYGDRLTMQCVLQCPSGYYGDASTKQCVSKCPIDTWGDEESITCVQRCPANTLGLPITRTCQQVCHYLPFTFRDIKNNLCADKCPQRTYVEEIKTQFNESICTFVCPDGYFAENNTKNCVKKCPNNSYGHPSLRLCVAQCDIQYPQKNQETNMCFTDDSTTLEYQTNIDTEYLILFIGIKMALIVFIFIFSLYRYQYLCGVELKRKNWQHDIMKDIDYSL